MKYLTAILLLGALMGCATQEKPQCWNNSTLNSNDFYKDQSYCQMEGDAGGAYLTGGLYAALAAKRKFNFCMQSKGYYLVSCKK